MHDQLLLQESKGEDGIKKEEMGISHSREDVQASQLEAQMESQEVAGGCCSLYWRRWQELCTATPAPAKTCFFRFTAKNIWEYVFLVFFKLKKRAKSRYRDNREKLGSGVRRKIE
ncbi:hypothetical protein NC653_032729 [Populus alba x Populus x berolinensis]|uniref:Uncharacterized protein n=1 Tax=Populus alba x Populus x berolinensis TaxID=444605 RepID=A0AAD6LT94_9ROSI|nr:hypothetical protein NC653_032729 [Populus alba x Populus x berolinensis]